MKPESERLTITKFKSGEMVSASEFNAGSLDYYFDVVHPLWVQEQATRQLDFDGQVWYKKVHPVVEEPSSEQKHLNRVVELISGITRCI